jgi:phage tail-like protein
MPNPLNYITTNRFYVEIQSQGSISASFSECSGLGVDIEYDEYSEGGVNDQRRVFLKQPKFKPVTLKRGMTNDLFFWNWLVILSNTKNTRKNVNILTFNQAGETMQCWTLIGAVPVSWKAPSLQAKGSEVAIEELTLIYEGLKVVANKGGGGATILSSGRTSDGYFLGS